MVVVLLGDGGEAGIGQPFERLGAARVVVVAGNVALDHLTTHRGLA